jgi:predicted DsbA family dithiol-disulfide isomerase
MRQVRLTYYLDVLSSWCLIAEDALARVRTEFGDRIQYEWKIAALRDPLNYTPEQLRWYYARTNSVTGVRLNPIWLESTADGTKWANVAAEAARGLGCTDDRVRLALARSAMVDGKRMSQRDVAVATAAAAGGLPLEDLARAMDDPQTAARIRASSDEFTAYRVDVRPTFVMRSAIADTSVLSGCWRFEVLAAAIRGLLEDQDKYDEFVATEKAPAGVV